MLSDLLRLPLYPIRLTLVRSGLASLGSGRADLDASISKFPENPKTPYTASSVWVLNSDAQPICLWQIGGLLLT